MTDQTKSNVQSWIIGLITGAGITAPITVFIVKHICERQTLKTTVNYCKKQLETKPSIAQEEDDHILKEEDYEAREDDGIPSAEEINNYDMTIDDEEASRKAAISVEDQERYRDMIQKYNNNLATVPFMIDAEQFGLDQTHEKSFINWYDEDNIFEEDLLKIDKPLVSFGVEDGNELFAYDPKRPDPNTVYIRNNEQRVDYEITKVHGSYSEKVLGIGMKENDQTDSDE